MSAYTRLLLLEDTQDPSEVFNLIDEVRVEASDLDDLQTRKAEVRCAELESKIHRLYTPTGFLILA